MLDTKGRVTMPAKHREALQEACALKVTLTRHPDGCVLIYPREVWQQRREALAELPYSARVLQRIVLGSAVDTAVENGRILIPNDLRTLCGLGKEVVLVGMGQHFELWDAVRLAEAEKAAVAAGLAEQAADFRF